MAATQTQPASAGPTSSWRALGRMSTYQVPIVLGSALGVFGGLVTYVLAVARRAALVAPSTEAIFMVVLGAVGLIGYALTKTNVKNGAIVAAVAGVGLVVLGGGIGFFAGLIVLAGAIWGLVRSM